MVIPNKSLYNIKLTSSHENLDNALSIVNDSIIIFDNEGTIKYINPAAIELFELIEKNGAYFRIFCHY